MTPLAAGVLHRAMAARRFALQESTSKPLASPHRRTRLHAGLGLRASSPPFAGGTPIGANFGRGEAVGAIEAVPSPPPLWGRAREGGRFGLDETQPRGRLSRPSPTRGEGVRGAGSSSIKDVRSLRPTT